MKNKIIASILTVTTLIASFVSPVSAVEIDETIESELCDFAYNFVGDTIVFTDDDGIILEVRPNDATTYSVAAGALILTASGSGALAAGSASILGGALPVLSYLLAAGFQIFSVQGLADTVMDIYQSLSDDAKDECAGIVDSGANSFKPSASLKSELDAALGNVFYTDDGSLISSGITFDPTNMLTYDFASQYVYGDEMTSSIYKYSLSSTAVSIPGTSISVGLVSEPFEGHAGAPVNVSTALQITNSATGASMVFMPESDSEFLESGHCLYRVSAPVVQTYAAVDDVYHRLGFWVSKQCILLSNGNACSDCLKAYESHFYGEAESLSKSNYVLFQNTGIDGLDDILFSGQYYSSSNGNFQLWRAVEMDGISSISLRNSALVTLFAALSYAISHTGTVATDNDIYLAPSEALSNADTLTQTGAVTGDFTTVLDNPAIDNPEVDSPAVSIPGLAGLVEGVLEGVMSIVNGVGSMLSGGANFIAGIPDFFDSVLDIFMFWKEADAHGAVGH